MADSPAGNGFPMTNDKKSQDNATDATEREGLTPGEHIARARNEREARAQTTVCFSGGPLDGQERQLDDTGHLAAQYPGYSATEQELAPQTGQTLLVQWCGSEADEAGYATEAFTSEQERERRGNETGVREPRKDDEPR